MRPDWGTERDCVSKEKEKAARCGKSVNLALGRQKREDPEFDVIFGYLVDSKLAWDT